MLEQHYAFQKLLELKKKFESLKIYILVDGIQYERFLDEQLKEGEGQISLFSLPEDKILSFAGPWLLDVSKLPREKLEKIFSLEQTYPAVSWILSEQVFLKLAQYMRSCLMVSLPSKETGLFRYYDCRVLRMLPEILSSEQITQLTKYSIQWVFLEDGKFTSIQKDGNLISKEWAERNVS